MKRKGFAASRPNARLHPANPNRPEVSTKLKIGFVAGENELHLVEDICAEANAPALAKISCFPGTPLSAQALAFNGELIPRIMDEDRDGNGPDKAMNPLVGSEIAAMKAKIKANCESFKRAKNIKYVAVGNEVDNDRYWQKDKSRDGDPAEYGMGFARHVYPIIRSYGFKIIHEGPQGSVAQWKPYIKGLKNAAMLTAADGVSFHSYQSSNTAHWTRVDDWRLNYAPQFPFRRFETEFGLKLAGAIEYQEVEMNKLYDVARIYAAKGYVNTVCHYRIKRNNAPESVPSPFNSDGSKHPLWHRFMVEQLKSVAA